MNYLDNRIMNQERGLYSPDTNRLEKFSPNKAKNLLD
jgi:hypothetical protein